MEITYINEENTSITLKQSKPHFLTKLDGAGHVRQTVNTFQAPGQDGAFYISSTLDMRNITLEGNIVAESSDEAFDYRRRLLRAFTPKQRGTLVYRDRQISCVVEEAAFSVSNSSRAPAFFISLLCPSPFFETLDEIREELALWRENFSFPLEITAPGIELGIRQPSQIIDIDNAGDVAGGCRIVFRALGSVTNPELMNVDTGEYIRLNTTMAAEQEIQVYTYFAGKKVVSITGASSTNAFSWVDVGSTFLQLSAGRNTLRYAADENVDLLEVTVYYRPQFLGI
jgi:Phage tail protein.